MLSLCESRGCSSLTSACCLNGREVKGENLTVFTGDTDHKEDLNAANEIALMKNAMENLRSERDSAVNDIQDLWKGMQVACCAFTV